VKIAILTPHFPPRWLAGTEIASYYIAKYLATRGHEVHVVTQRDPGLPRNQYIEGFHIHRIGIPNLKVGGLTLFILDLCILLTKMQPHIIHAQSIPMGLPCLIICKKLLKIPFVVMGQGSDVYGYWPYKSLISRLVLKNADAVIALTKDMEMRMLEMYTREILVIPNGVETETFSAITREDARRTLGIDAHEKIILYVGRLHPVKGVKYLVKAMDIIRSYENNVKLIIVGDGEQRNYLLRLTREFNLENHIIFIGKVPHQKIPTYLKAADVFVLPSLREGFSLVILEAMAAGLPVIATRVGVVPEVIKDYENGFIVEPMNPHQIAEKCLLLLKDEKLRERMSSNNIEKAREFSWERVVENLEKLYLTLLKRY